MDRLGIQLHRDLESVDVYHDHFLAACIGLASEALEVLDEVNVATRPWVDTPDEEIRDAIAQETIDALFYLLEIFAFLKIRPFEIFRLYEAKWHINIRRIESKSKNS